MAFLLTATQASATLTGQIWKALLPNGQEPNNSFKPTPCRGGLTQALGDMRNFVLTAAEDYVLAIAEADHVSMKLTCGVLSTWFSRRVSYAEIVSITDRLSALGLIRWRIKELGKLYFRRHVKWPQHTKNSSFIATKAGELHLAKPRHVA